MRKLFFAFLVLLIAVSIAYLIHLDSGYVLISYGKWSMETSVWVGFLALVVCFLSLYFIARLISNTASLSKRFREWRKERRDHQSIALTNAGLCELVEGNWKNAENDLIDAAENSTTPLINYLAAARAAQALQAYDRRDAYLKKAHQSTSGSRVAICLCQAQLQIENKQWEHAFSTLQHLEQISPRHQYGIELMLEVLIELQDWKKLIEYSSIAKKNHVIDSNKQTRLEQMAYLNLIKQNSISLENIPKQYRENTEIVKAYINQINATAGADDVTQLIERSLKQNWDSELVEAYSTLKSEHPEKQLVTAEHWLKKYPHDPSLLLCCGKLALQTELTGKAKDYLSSSLTLRPTFEACYALAGVYESLGDVHLALEYYKKSGELGFE